MTLAVAARLVLFVVGIGGLSTTTVTAYLAADLVLGVVWAAAAWMVTPRRLVKRWPWMWSLRLFVRASQLLWPAAYGCWLIAVIDATARLDGLIFALRLTAGVGVIVLAMMLSQVAIEGQRETAA